MEHQHSINSILSFGAKSVAPDILEQLLIGRDKTAEHLMHAVDSIAKNGLNQHILVIGQRGMGKTHLIRVVHHRATKYIDEEKLVAAYFSEEEYGVSDFFDFLIRVIYAFQRWNDVDKDFFQQRIEDLQNTPQGNQTLFAEKIIADYIGNRPLLLLCENFGDILEAIGTTEQGKLRAWLYKNERISIIATSQSISENLDSEDRPFFGFFQLIYLKTLTYRDTYNFLISLAKLEDREDVIQHLGNRGQSQVRAIHELVKGNHRLLVTFYQFLKSDTLAKLSHHFIKTINDLKPYYETYIRYLPPMQQKVLRYIALARKPQQGTEIAKNCFIEAKTLSKQLSELTRKRLVEAIPDPSDKRNRLYDIEEPLLRISIEVGEHKEGITALFIDFLALYYDENELKGKISKFSDLLQNCQNSQEKAEFQYEIKAIERALDIKKTNGRPSEFDIVIEEVKKAFEKDDFTRAIELAERAAKRTGKPMNNPFDDLLCHLYMLSDRLADAAAHMKKIGTERLTEKKLIGRYGIVLAKLDRAKERSKLYPEILSYFELAEKNGEEQDSIILEWGDILIKQGLHLNDDHLIERGFQKFDEAKKYYPGLRDPFMRKGANQITIGLQRDDKSMFLKAWDNFAEANRLEPKDVTVLRLWGVSVAIIADFFQIPKSVSAGFRKALKALTLAERIEIWKILSDTEEPELIILIGDLLLKDLKKAPEALNAITTAWLINILGYKEERISRENIKKLKEMTDELTLIVPELGIVGLYIDTYEEFYLNKNKNAFFALPKEQRIFFKKHIMVDVADE